MGKYFMALMMVCTASLASPPAVLAVPLLVTYTFTGAPGDQASQPADSQPSGAFFSDITRGPGVTPVAVANTMSSSSWTTSAAPDLANDYYEFSLRPSNSYEVTLTDLTFGVGASLGGPTAFEVRTSVDGLAAPIIAFHSLPPDVTYLNEVNLTAFPGFQNLPASVVFRLYAYNASSPAGVFELIDLGPNGPGVQVSGTVIPEPSTLILLGLGLAGLARRRLRSIVPA